MKLGGNIWTIVGGFIGLVVMFLIVAELYPTMADAGDTLNSSGIPLGTLFVSGGVVFVLIAAGVLYAVFKNVAH